MRNGNHFEVSKFRKMGERISKTKKNFHNLQCYKIHFTIFNFFVKVYHDKLQLLVPFCTGRFYMCTPTKLPIKVEGKIWISIKYTPVLMEFKIESSAVQSKNIQYTGISYRIR